jgi:plasmid stabilization system protein ParE
MGKIKWTEKASCNLESIHEYISRDSEIYATRFAKSLIKATKRLVDMPYSGRIVHEFESNDFREVIFRRMGAIMNLGNPGCRVLRDNIYAAA